MMMKKYDVAKFMFNNALEIDATLFEAIYNMGTLQLNFYWTFFYYFVRSKV